MQAFLTILGLMAAGAFGYIVGAALASDRER